jgi:hypothetical protein
MSPRLVPVDSNPEQPISGYAKNAMSRLWQNAEDRETGTEAVVAIRARHQHKLEAKAEKNSGRVKRFLLGRS